MRSRVIFVTGGTGGLGETVVRRLVEDGFICVVAYRKRSKFDAFVSSFGASGQVHGVRADLSDPESIETAADVMSELGQPWGLVHLAGGFSAGAATETAMETWDAMMELNLRGAFIALKAVARQLRGGGCGRLTFVGSTAALDLPVGIAAYTVSKSAVTSLVTITAKELSGTGITVNAVLPDALDTDAMRSSDLGIPLVSLDRVASAIAWLLSDGAAAVTGTLVPIRSE